MDLPELLDNFDRTSANLKQLEAIWEKASFFLPESPTLGTQPEYENLRRAWTDILPHLPPINGWTITEPLPDIDALGHALLEYAEIGEPPYQVIEAKQKPANDLAEYRYKLDKARRSIVKERISDLIAQIERDLPLLLRGVDRNSSVILEGSIKDNLLQAFDELPRLMGDTPRQSERWGDLHRHLSFGHGQDWHDIWLMDWPSIKPDVLAATFHPEDPLPVPKVDLGDFSSRNLSGKVSSALAWDRLDASDFERLLFDLLQNLDDHQNVRWLQKTNAPDGGRDLECERVLRDGAGGVRTERVVIQAKHWQANSVSLDAIAPMIHYMDLLKPPVVRTLVVATSGTFTKDAVNWADRRNESGQPPHLELWSHSRLESLLANHPYVAAQHGLR